MAFRALRVPVRLLLLAAFFCSLCLYVPAQAAENLKFGAQGFVLDNGMQVVVIPNHRAPVVTHMVWYKVGSADEPRGQSGIAHFVEHLMFKGTEKIPPGEFSKTIRALGGNDNAFTSYDFTAYFQSISSDHLEKIMEMEADRMNGLLFPQNEVDSERLVVIEERRERTENDPRGYFGEQMRSLLYINHPYGNPVIGWFHEVDALNRDGVKAFHDTWYAPNNAILVIAGDTTLDEVKPLAEKYYGGIPRKNVPAREWTGVPPLPGVATLAMRHESIKQPTLTRLYRVPSYNQNKEESLALQVLENILDGGAATRLYKSFVVDQKIATSAGFSYEAGRISDSTLSISLVPADGVTLQTLEDALDKELRLLVSDGVTDAELAEAKTRLIDDAVYDRDSLSGPAMIFGAALSAGSTLEDVETWPAQIGSVTTAQVQDAARKYLNPDDSGKRPYVSGHMLPPATKEAVNKSEDTAP